MILHAIFPPESDAGAGAPSGAGCSSGVAKVRDVGQWGAVRRERNDGAEGAVGAAEDDERWFGVFRVGVGEAKEDWEM